MNLSGLIKVFEPDPASCKQAVPCLFDAAQESRVMFETVFEPVIFRLEADQHARRFAMTRDDDLLRHCLSKKPRQIILDFGKGYFLHSGSANFASHDSASDLATIAKTSTPEPQPAASRAMK
jgi:hypothetical protein